MALDGDDIEAETSKAKEKNKAKDKDSAKGKEGKAPKAADSEQSGKDSKEEGGAQQSLRRSAVLFYASVLGS